ncbi:PIN domain-containing protein [Streptomyces roseolus]|uniref:PIN domain-containing protein n=1 Tax=Streptomyces roseolus TaxID=67358 RepID=UPI00364ABE81
MLIFDTNAVKDLDPHGSKADLLRMLGKAGLEIGAPWVVIEELTAHKLYDYQRAFDLMRRQHQALSTLEPNLAGPVPKFQGAEFVRHWRRQYSEIFTNIPTSQQALQAAVLREAACMKPAKVEVNNKSGGRDVAIWFSVLEYMEANPGKEVYFISSNTKDFGDPNEWPFPLDVDLGENSTRLTHVLTFEEILEKFTQPSNAPDDVGESLIARLLAPKAGEVLIQEVWGRHLRQTFGSKIKQRPSHTRLGMDPQISGPIECRKIEDSTWYWSKVSWQVYALQEGSEDPFLATWDTTILFPESEDGGVSLLRSGRLGELAPEDMSEALKSSLTASLEREADRFDDMLYPSEDETRLDLDGDLEIPPTIRRPIKPLKSRLRAEDAAFKYERRVLQSLGRVAGHVRYLSGAGDLGLDALVEVEEGAIGVIIKYRLHPHGIREATWAANVPSRIADAILTITNSPVTEQTELAIGSQRRDFRPQEIARWSGERDDAALARVVRRIRHQLSATP